MEQRPTLEARRVLVLAMILAVLGATLHLCVTSKRADGRFPVVGDAHYVHATALSLAFDGDLDLTNQYRALGDPWGLGKSPAADGWRFPPREIGPALLMVPGLWLHRSMGAAPERAPAWATVPTSLTPAGLFVLLFALLGRVPAASDEPLGFVARVGLAATASLGFVAPFYAIGPAGYAHAPDALVCAGLVWALLRRASAVEVGVWLAIAVLFRLQNLLWLAWPLLECWRAAPDRRRDEVRRALGVATIGLVGLAPQAWLAWRHPGSSAGSIRWDLGFFHVRGIVGDIVEVLIGVHGLLTWTPIAALAIAGLLVAAWRAPAPARHVAGSALVILFANVLLCASVRDPDGGWAFGARRFAGCTALLGVGLAWGWSLVGTVELPARWRRWILPGF